MLLWLIIVALLFLCKTALQHGSCNDTTGSLTWLTMEPTKQDTIYISLLMRRIMLHLKGLL